MSDFSLKIQRVLNNNPNNILISDKSTSLTGIDITKRAKLYASVFDKSSPKELIVGVLIKPSALQALIVISLLSEGYIPYIINISYNRDALSTTILSEIDYLVCNPKQIVSLKLSSILKTEKNILEECSIYSIRSKRRYIREPPAPGTALIINTSGSTGEPKAINILKKSILYTIETLTPILGVEKSTKAQINMLISHTMALNTQFLPTFFSGGQCNFSDMRLDVGKIYNDIVNSKCNFVTLVSDYIGLCYREMNRYNIQPDTSVTIVQIAGGNITTDHLDQASTLFPNAKIFKGYGLTEAIRVSMISSDSPYFFEDCAGYALAEQDIVILDDTGTPLPPGEIGEVAVSGPNLSSNLMDRTITINSNNYLKTSDIGYIDDRGLLFLKGRKDHMFKIRGIKVSPWQIENTAHKADFVVSAKCIPMKFKKNELRPALAIEVVSSSTPLTFLINQLEIIFQNHLEPFKRPKNIFIINLSDFSELKVNHESVRIECTKMFNTAEHETTALGTTFYFPTNNEVKRGEQRDLEFIG